MSEVYVNLNHLENLFAERGIPYTDIFDELRKYSTEDIVATLSTTELSEALDARDEVFATQVWQREDIHTALHQMGFYNADSGIIDAIMKEAEDSLEDCSDGWEKLQAAVRSCMLRKEHKK